MTLIHDINNILEFGRKTKSYKYTTLLAIFDFITEHRSGGNIKGTIHLELNFDFFFNHTRTDFNRSLGLIKQKKG